MIAGFLLPLAQELPSWLPISVLSAQVIWTDDYADSDEPPVSQVPQWTLHSLQLLNPIVLVVQCQLLLVLSRSVDEMEHSVQAVVLQIALSVPKSVPDAVLGVVPCAALRAVYRLDTFAVSPWAVSVAAS